MRVLAKLTAALAACLMSACGPNTPDDLPPPGPSQLPGGPAGNQGSTVPSALVGQWRFEAIGDQTCDPNTGTCLPTYVHVETLALTADGRFTFVLVGESHFPPCSLIATAEASGRATVQGVTLTLFVEQGFTRREDSCGENGQTDERGQSWLFTWALADSGQLTLTNDEGVSVGPFQRQSSGQ